jgi:hypothetical protein
MTSLLDSMISCILAGMDIHMVQRLMYFTVADIKENYIAMFGIWRKTNEIDY